MEHRRCGNSLRRRRRGPPRSLYTGDKPFHRFNELSFLSEVYRIRCRPSSKRNAPMEGYFERTIKQAGGEQGAGIVWCSPSRTDFSQGQEFSLALAFCREILQYRKRNGTFFLSNRRLQIYLILRFEIFRKCEDSDYLTIMSQKVLRESLFKILF